LLKTSKKDQLGSIIKNTGTAIHLVDVINIALFHCIHYLTPLNDLMALQNLYAFKKLTPQYNQVNKDNKLLIISDNIDAIKAMTKSYS
jgi:hypothetical protein